jgi:hypothetical protein
VLICEGSKGDQLNGGGTGLPQVRDLVSRIALLLFEVDLARFFSDVLEQYAFCTPLFLKAALIPSTARSAVALGAWKADPGNWPRD